MDSPDITRLRDIDRNGMRIYLFVRKNKDDSDGGKEFCFLGCMLPTQHYEQFVMANTDKTAVEITYRLDTPVRADIYDYLTSRFEEEWRTRRLEAKQHGSYGVYDGMPCGCAISVAILAYKATVAK